MDHGQNIKVSDVHVTLNRTCCNESKYHLAAVRANFM